MRGKNPREKKVPNWGCEVYKYERAQSEIVGIGWILWEWANRVGRNFLQDWWRILVVDGWWLEEEAGNERRRGVDDEWWSDGGFACGAKPKYKIRTGENEGCRRKGTCLGAGTWFIKVSYFFRENRLYNYVLTYQNPFFIFNLIPFNL